MYGYSMRSVYVNNVPEDSVLGQQARAREINRVRWNEERNRLFVNKVLSNTTLSNYRIDKLIGWCDPVLLMDSELKDLETKRYYSLTDEQEKRIEELYQLFEEYLDD